MSFPNYTEKKGGHCWEQVSQTQMLKGAKQAKQMNKLGVKVLVTESCMTLCEPMDYNLPGSSVHGILQSRILNWVAMFFSSGSSWPRNQTFISCISCIAGGFFTVPLAYETSKIFFASAIKNTLSPNNFQVYNTVISTIILPQKNKGHLYDGLLSWQQW